MSPEPITAEHLAKLGFHRAPLFADSESFQIFQRRLDSGPRIDVRLWLDGRASVRSSFPPYSGFATSPADLARQIEFLIDAKTPLHTAAEGTRFSGTLPVTCANESRAERGSGCADPSD